MDELPTLKHMVKTTHRTEYPRISPRDPANSATNKIVFVTGGGSGIGFATARSFALAGAKAVIIAGRRGELVAQKATELAAELPSTQILSYPLDIADENAVKNVFADARQRLNADLDILVLNAANILAGVPALSYTSDQIRAAFDTTFIGNVSVLKAFLSTVDPTNSEARTNKVVLDISTHSIYERYPLHALYGPSKLSLTYFIRHLGAEYAHTGLRVHSYHPGAILTEPNRSRGLTEDSYDWDDVSLPAGLAVWLASPAADFLNGRFILSGWDVDELSAMRDEFERDPDLGRVVLKVKPNRSD